MSKEPTRFKQTEIGELPEEWEVVRLEDVARVFSGSSAPQGREYFENGIFPFVRVQDLARYGQTRCLTEVTDKVNERAVQEHHLVLARKGTILFPKSGAALEKNHRAILGVDAYIVSHLAAVEANPEKVDNEFLFWWLCCIDMASLNPNPGYPSIRLEEIKNLTIPLPPLEEQKRIAGVLRLVDRIAEETRRIVSIYERAKRFALKRLLTRGIGHTRFKQTEIGELPEEWEVLRLEDVSKIETGRRMKGGAQSSGQVLSLGGEHIGEFGNIVLKNPKYISKEFYDKMKKGKLDIGDVIMCKDGAKTGKVGYIKEKYAEFMTVNEHVFIIRSKDSNILINQFLFYVLFSEIGQSQVKSSFHGLIGGITYEDLKSFLIPLPPLEEQKRIAEMLSTIDAAIENERRYLGVLEKCKRWLLDTLLTGKIRLPSKIDDILKEVLTDAS
jgi:type I restriction enzyme S subunit